MIPLLNKIKNEERQQADTALKTFFDTLNVLCIDKDHKKIPEEALLGIIDKMYKKFNSERDESVSLVTFSKYLVSLAIVYMKSNFDESVWISDFVSFNLTIAQKKLRIRAFTKLEENILKEVGFVLNVDLDHVGEILRKLNSAEIINDFLQDAEDLKFESSFEFDSFLIKMSKLKDEIIQSQTIMEHSFAALSKINVPVLEKPKSITLPIDPQMVLLNDIVLALAVEEDKIEISKEKTSILSKDAKQIMPESPFSIQTQTIKYKIGEVEEKIINSTKKAEQGLPEKIWSHLKMIKSKNIDSKVNFFFLRTHSVKKLEPIEIIINPIKAPALD